MHETRPTKLVQIVLRVRVVPHTRLTNSVPAIRGGGGHPQAPTRRRSSDERLHTGSVGQNDLSKESPIHPPDIEHLKGPDTTAAAAIRPPPDEQLLGLQAPSVASGLVQAN